MRRDPRLPGQGFEQALRLAGRLGEQLVQGVYDGLTDGTLRA
ncbi:MULTISPECIES: hypothetical protein [unclassified Streptomyces]|nr:MULTISPECIES: hypothetical protein [unclassified Streptomyces]